MTWEDTIRFIRTRHEYKELIDHAYLDENLKLNVERFRASSEFRETLNLVEKYAPSAKKILDVGAGNGISSAAFALMGYNITVAEPDPSNTVGRGAIETLKKEYNLANLNVINSFGENLPFEDNSFDIVYIRQAMHHAEDLISFIKEAARVIKPGGVLMTIRDHVVFGKKDKQEFLDSHPLQKYYGGENAFSAGEYAAAMKKAQLKIVLMLRYYDSIINYFPQSKDDVKNVNKRMHERFQIAMQKRFGTWVVNFPFLQLLELAAQFKNGKWSDERRIPGRMYSFIAIKNHS